jgi:hypothetical protein
LKLSGTHQIFAYADDINILGENIDTIQKNTEAVLDASKEVGLEMNLEKTKYIHGSAVLCCEISSSHGGEYDVQSCLLGCTAV